MSTIAPTTLSRTAVLATAFIFLATVIFLVRPAPAAASCGGITPVYNETELNAAIADFNSQTSACDYGIVLVDNILLSASTTTIVNSTAVTKLSIYGAGQRIDAQITTGVRPLEVGSGTNVYVENTVIQGGDQRPSGSGGGVLNLGSLTIKNSTIWQNTAESGGGISSSGVLTIIGSTIQGNFATADGGGIYNRAGRLNLINSTVAYNTGANHGGALYNRSFIGSPSVAHVTNSTLAENTASVGIGLYNYSGSTFFDNSIMANDGSGGECFFNTGAVNVLHSLVKNATLACAAVDGVDGNIVGHDPLLGGLQDNGGFTETMAPLANSPAINAGDNTLAVDQSGSPLTTDQRGVGFPRIAGTTVDIGAFEVPCAPFPQSVADEAALSEAIACFNVLTDPGTVTIGLSADIGLTKSPPTVDNDAPDVVLLLDGAGYTLGGQGNSGVRPFAIAANTRVTLQDITVSGGNMPSDAGGGIYNEGNLALFDTTISGNTAGLEGGGIWSAGTLGINNSTFSGNSAYFGGGAIYLASGGIMQLVNSTLSGNAADLDGGGIYADGSTVTTKNSTLSGNLAVLEGGAVYNAGGTVNLDNTILANSSSGGECVGAGGTVNARSSLIEDGLSCVNGTNSNNLIGDPLLGALADNGGPTQTHILLPGSPAFDAGSDALSNPLSTDQRGASFPRIQGVAVDIGALEVLCSTLLEVANQTGLNHAISCFNSQTMPGTYEVTLWAPIDLTASPLTIDNATAGIDLLLDGAGLAVYGRDIVGVRPFEIAAGSDVTIQAMIINGGNASGPGGGIYNKGTLTLERSVVSNNSGVSYGGGIENESGTLTVRHSTLTGNSVSGVGGGIDSYNGTAVISHSTIDNNFASTLGGGVHNETAAMTIVNSTLSANSSGSSGGGIYNQSDGTMKVTNSTLSGNGATSAGGGIANGATASALRFQNSIVANSTSGDCSGVVEALNSLFEDPGTPCGVSNGVNGNITGQDPDLGPLQDNGGFTQTHVFGSGSPVYNAGSNAAAVNEIDDPLTTDQRGVGFARILNTTVDMGAVEAQCAASFNVGGEAALNAAIDCYNALTAPGSYQITLGADITLTAQTSSIDNSTAGISLTIDGNGYTVDANDISGVRPFIVSTSTVVTLRNITLTGGNVSFGGGVDNFGTLTVEDSTITANSASSDGGGIHNSGDVTVTNSTISLNAGKGIYNNTGQLTVVDSTISDNTADFANGAGIYNVSGIVEINSSTISGNMVSGSGGGAYSGGGTVEISSSTFSGNTASGSGGAIYTSGGSLLVSNSTFSDNTADLDSVGGLYAASGMVTINNSILANNVNGDCYGTVTANHNLIEDNTFFNCDLVDGVNGNIIGLDPALGPLQDNGGPTETHALGAGSPAIEAGDNTACLSADQRGVMRPQATNCDMGSYEYRRLVITTVSTTDASLAWDNANIDCIYAIFESTTPYFTPTDPPTYYPATSPYSLTSKLGTVATNYFYINRAVCDDSTTYSNEVGEFDFALVPGN